MRYAYYAADQALEAQANAVWRAYYASQRAQRGLAINASLDMRDGVEVQPPITVRYAVPIRAAGVSGGALALEEFVIAMHGQNPGGGPPVNVAHAVELVDLPPALRAILAPGEP